MGGAEVVATAAARIARVDGALGLIDGHEVGATVVEAVLVRGAADRAAAAHGRHVGVGLHVRATAVVIAAASDGEGESSSEQGRHQ